MVNEPLPYFRSRKVVRSMRATLELLEDGTFQERDIKALLIEIREPARYMLRSAGCKHPILKDLSRLIDVCDCIAHPNREFGELEQLIRGEAEKIIDQMLHGKPDDMIKPVDAWSANEMVAQTAGVIGFVLDLLVPMNMAPVIDTLLKRQNEIALMMLSLLQDTTIKLKKSDALVSLQLRPHDDSYRLYCRLFSRDLFTPILPAGVRPKKMASLGFPVLSSGARANSAEMVAANWDAMPFPLLHVSHQRAGGLQIAVVE